MHVFAHASVYTHTHTHTHTHGFCGVFFPIFDQFCSLWSPLLQRKLPADSRVLEASGLVYTVSAHEYWQQAILTEEESGNFYFFNLNH